MVTAVVTFFVVRSYIAPSDFNPVTLSAKEERVLNAKLDQNPRGRYTNEP